MSTDTEWEWHVLRGQTRLGPLTDNAIRDLAASGGLTEDDLVWHAGLPDWIPAGSVPALLAPPRQPCLPVNDMGGSAEPTACHRTVMPVSVGSDATNHVTRSRLSAPVRCPIRWSRARLPVALLRSDGRARSATGPRPNG